MECVIEIDSDGCAEHYIDIIIALPYDVTCYECGDVIKKKTSLHLFSGNWYSDLYVHKTCTTCREIIDKMFCDFMFTCLWEDLSTILYDDDLPICALEGLSSDAINKI